MAQKPKLCNQGRCRKPAIVGFRPYRDGYDVTLQVGIQYCCEPHGQGLLRDGKPFTPHTWLIGATS